MATPLVGPLGVATTKGDLFVVDANGELERLAVGADGQVLVADSTDPLGVQWKNSSAVALASLFVDATLAIFKKIDLGAGAINNPAAKTRGTHSVLAYDDTAVEGIAWQNFMPQLYTAGSSLRVDIYWAAATAIAGNVIWAGAFENLASGNSIITDGFAAAQTAVAVAAPGVLGNLAKSTITFTSAQIDGLAAGDPMRFFLQRTATAVGDTMVGDADLVRVVISEV